VTGGRRQHCASACTRPTSPDLRPKATTVAGVVMVMPVGAKGIDSKRENLYDVSDPTRIMPGLIPEVHAVWVESLLKEPSLSRDLSMRPRR